MSFLEVQKGRPGRSGSWPVQDLMQNGDRVRSLIAREQVVSVTYDRSVDAIRFMTESLQPDLDGRRDVWRMLTTFVWVRDTSKSGDFVEMAWNRDNLFELIKTQMVGIEGKRLGFGSSFDTKITKTFIRGQSNCNVYEHHLIFRDPVIGDDIYFTLIEKNGNQYDFSADSARPYPQGSALALDTIEGSDHGSVTAWLRHHRKASNRPLH